MTGSNATLLSSDLGTLLTGRVVEIPVETLSFAELAAAQATVAQDELLARYLRIGGFPVLHALDYDQESAASYTATLVDAILMRDVVHRHSIRDPDALHRILAFAYDNVGSITSARRITDHWKSQRRSVSVDTTVNYLSYLCDSFLLRRVQRLTLRGRKHLEYGEKYYAGDIGLRRGLLGGRSSDIAAVLENLVYLELVRRGCTVSVGDQWPKAVLTFAPAPIPGRGGIPVIPLRDFFLGTEQRGADHVVSEAGFQSDGSRKSTP